MMDFDLFLAKNLLTVFTRVGAANDGNGFLITNTESIRQALTTFSDIVVTSSSNHLK